MAEVIAIAAMDEGRVIGFENRLPWNVPEDMKRFMRLTKSHAVLMGRKTYESLPKKSRPLPERFNIVATRSPERLAHEQEILVTNSARETVEQFRRGELSTPTDTLWIVGGEEIYRETLPLCDGVYLTRIAGTHQGDAYFPKFESEFEVVQEQRHDGYAFLNYARKAQ